MLLYVTIDVGQVTETFVPSFYLLLQQKWGQ